MHRSKVAVLLCVLSACASMSGCGLWVDAFAPKPDAPAAFDARVPDASVADAPGLDAPVAAIDAGPDSPRDDAFSNDAFSNDAFSSDAFVCGAGTFADELLCRPCESRVSDIGVPMPAVRLISARCPPGEVAVGIGGATEVRSYVSDYSLFCVSVSDLSAAPRIEGTPALPYASTCLPGQVVVGFQSYAGDVLDRLGVICRPLVWTAATPGGAGSSVFGNGMPLTEHLCPEGHVVTGVEGEIVYYVGADTARGITAICEPLVCL